MDDDVQVLYNVRVLKYVSQKNIIIVTVCVYSRLVYSHLTNVTFNCI